MKRPQAEERRGRGSRGTETHDQPLDLALVVVDADFLQRGPKLVCGRHERRPFGKRCKLRKRRSV
jgi:hypothetical protein